MSLVKIFMKLWKNFWNTVMSYWKKVMTIVINFSTICIKHDVIFSDFHLYKGRKIDTERLGIAQLTGYTFENPDGSSFKMSKDGLGNERTLESPCIGPIEKAPSAKRVKIWGQ